MSNFTCIILCLMAVSLTKVSAVTEEEKAAFREAMAPIIAECSKEHGVSEGDIKAAKEAGSVEGIKTCFLGCLMKKTNVIDSQGLFDVDKGLGQLKQFVKSEEDLAKFEEVGRACASVNDQAVSDGDAGCERAKLVLACALEHKAEIPF